MSYSLSRRVPAAVPLALSAGLALCASSGDAAAKDKYKVVYSFCEQAGFCDDGQNPISNVVKDSKGNLYGSVGASGHDLLGGIYRIQHNGKQSLVHTFCSQQLCADGQYAQDLIIDQGDNLYGVTSGGGNGGNGVVFRLARRNGAWRYSVLHTFCSQHDCKDGSQPRGGLAYQGQETGALYDGVSPLYGTASMGGQGQGGVVFRLTFQPGKKRPAYDVLYDFCAAKDCADGSFPTGRMALGAAGEIYGVASSGGVADGMDENGNGVAYELAPKDGGFRQTVLYTFCRQTDCADGAAPMGLAIDKNGVLFGTTETGGANGRFDGTVFKLVPNGKNSELTLLHSFCSEANCADGYQPNSGPIVGPNGDVYGATYNGGVSLSFGGIAFKLHRSAYSVIHTFCQEEACTDGTQPETTLFRDTDGSLFGTTLVGGGNGVGGVLYQIKKP